MTASQRAQVVSPFEQRMLRHANQCTGEFDGMSPFGPNQLRACRHLEALGLLSWVGPGECGDGCDRAGDHPHEVNIFAITDAGKARVENKEWP